MKTDLWKMVGFRWDREELQKWSSLKRTAYLLMPLLIYFVAHDIAEILLYFLLNILLTAGGGGALHFLGQYHDTIRGAVYGAASLIGVAAIFPIVKEEIRIPDLHKNKSAEGQQINEKKVTPYCLLAAFAFCAAAGINIFFWLTGLTGSSQTYNEVHEMQFGVQFGAGLVLYGIISPLAEEAVFRGVLYNRMKRCFNYKIALLVSSFLFGIYHGNLVQAVYGSILGLMIAYSYERYKNFAAPVLFHAVANVSVYVMTYQNRLAKIDRNNALLLGTFFIIGAIAIFFCIKRKYLREGIDG